MKRLGFATLILLSTIGCEAARSPSTREPSSTSDAARTETPSNTGVNVRDREATAKTPFDQGESRDDIKVTANIRKQVVDANMSTSAENVKIVTANGRVTLRGPVKTEDERTKINQIAEGVAGAGNVDNQLEVSSSQ